jgi:hypothetical protein
MDARKQRPRTASTPAVDVAGAVRIQKHRRARSAAQENPQAFPEVSSKELMHDLEGSQLDDLGDL